MEAQQIITHPENEQDFAKNIQLLYRSLKEEYKKVKTTVLFTRALDEVTSKWGYLFGIVTISDARAVWNEYRVKIQLEKEIPRFTSPFRVNQNQAPVAIKKPVLQARLNYPDVDELREQIKELDLNEDSYL